jgi:hypothetical protein
MRYRRDLIDAVTAMHSQIHTRRCSSPLARVAFAAAAVVALAVVQPTCATAVSFSTAPNVPNLATVTLNAHGQTINGTMNNFSVSLGVLETGGFNVTVNGDASAGHSAVFKVYCPGPSACGPDAVGYVTGGSTLAADSLTLDSTGASWSGGPAMTPSMLCNSGCNLDHASAVRVASEAAGGLNVLGGTWTSGGWSATSIALAAPTTLRTPLQSGEIYHLDLLWTLNTGP